MKKIILFINKKTTPQLLSMMRIMLALLFIVLIIGIATDSKILSQLAYGLTCLSGTLLFAFWTKIHDGTVEKKSLLTKSKF
jgi:hypothetical protein